MTMALPDDILAEIFSRLPSKSVGRFHCLSRSWAATLKSASFVDLHLRQANHRQRIPKLFSTAAHLDDPENKWPVKVLTKPCHGLVLLHRPPQNGHYVCNPSTGQLLRLPDSEGRGRRSCASYGLGYSLATKEYKVVRLLASYNSTPCCEVFTLDVSTHRRVVAQKPQLGSGAARSPVVFCDGYLHFLFLLRQQGGTRTSIFAFDVVNETFGSLTVPLAAQSNACPLELAVLDGNLCMCIFRYRRPPGDVEPYCIWRLACREAGRWEKLYGILQPQTTKPELDYVRLSWVSPLEIYSAGNGQKKIMFATEERVLAFDIHVGGTLKILVPRKEITGTIRQGDVGLLEESLVSVGRTSEDIIYSSPWRKAWSDVLKWMPTRSVVTLMCVCKEWRAVTNSDRFLQTHALHTNIGKTQKIKFVNAHLYFDLFYHPRESCERVQHAMRPFLLDGIGVLGLCSKPCHRLVLVTCTYMERSCIHYLCNPSRDCSSRILLDERDAVDSLGLGYDLRLNKNVLVRIVCYKKGSRDHKLESYIQLTDTKSWII